MRYFRSLFFLILFFLLGCDADPGLKQWVKVDPTLVEKPVNVNFVPQVDILFVVDDSGSMSVFQNNLSSNIDDFIDSLFDSRFIDFHVGVTTSSVDDSQSISDNGKLIDTAGRNYVDRNLKDGKNILKRYLLPGVNGDAQEEFFSVVQMALTEPNISTVNSGFYRKNAHLVVFFLTDADDQSKIEPEEFFDFLVNLKNGRTERIHIAAAIQDIPQECRSGESDPIKFHKFVDISKGRFYNLCLENYGKNLAKLAREIIERVSVIRLQEVPVPSTIEVSYGSQLIPQGPGRGWTYNATENSIYLGSDLELRSESVGTKLGVTYERVFDENNNSSRFGTK